MTHYYWEVDFALSLLSLFTKSESEKRFNFLDHALPVPSLYAGIGVFVKASGLFWCRKYLSRCRYCLPLVLT